MEEKLDRIEKNISDLTGAVGALTGKVDTIEKNVNNLAGTVVTIEKNLNDLTEIVIAIKDHMVTHLATKQELAEGLGSLREELTYKIEGVQRAVDAGFERDSAIEARVTKLEAAL